MLSLPALGLCCLLTAQAGDAPVTSGPWLVHGAEPEGASGLDPVFLRHVLDSKVPEAELAGWSQAANGTPAACWSFARVESPKDQVVIARVQGMQTLYVGGEAYHGGPGDVPPRAVWLRKGANSVLVLDPDADGFQLAWEAAANSEIALLDRVTHNVPLPYRQGMRLQGYYSFRSAFVPVLSTSITGTPVHLHYGLAVPPGAPGRIHEWSCGSHALPRCLVEIHAALTSPQAGGDDLVGESLALPIHVSSSGHESGALDFGAARTFAPLWLHGEAAKRAQPPPSILGKIVLVPGTQGQAEQNATLLALARFDQQRLWEQTGHLPSIVLDRDYEEPGFPLRESLALFYGNQDTHSLVSRWLGPESEAWVHSGRLERGNQDPVRGDWRALRHRPAEELPARQGGRARCLLFLGTSERAMRSWMGSPLPDLLSPPEGFQYRELPPGLD